MNTRKTALIEFIGFAAFALLLKELLEPFFWRFCGPVSLLVVLLLVAIYMRHRGLAFSCIGLIRISGTRSFLLLIPQTILAIVAIVGTGLAVGHTGEALGITFMSDLDAASVGVKDRWGNIAGNPGLYLLWLILSWVSGGFAEELFFRGFLITRLQTAFSGIRFAPVIAIVFPALVFGYGHVYYQGLRGLVMTTSIGISLGILFLLFRRNIWPLVLAHGIIDSLAFTAIYFDLDI